MRDVLIDSGCSRCIVYKTCCTILEKRSITVTTVNGQKQRCLGTTRISLRVHNCQPVNIDALVVDFKPLGFECILGVNAIASLGGVTILSSLEVCFGASKQGVNVSTFCASARESEIAVEGPDYRVSFDADQKMWTASWKWSNDSEPLSLRNRVTEYTIPAGAREEYEAEVQEWINKGWLKPDFYKP